MTAKGLANFGIALIALAGVEPGAATIAARPAGTTADEAPPWILRGRAAGGGAVPRAGSAPAAPGPRRNERREPGAAPPGYAPADR